MVIEFVKTSSLFLYWLLKLNCYNATFSEMELFCPRHRLEFYQFRIILLRKINWMSKYNIKCYAFLQKPNNWRHMIKTAILPVVHNRLELPNSLMCNSSIWMLQNIIHINIILYNCTIAKVHLRKNVVNPPEKTTFVMIKHYEY